MLSPIPIPARLPSIEGFPEEKRFLGFSKFTNLFSLISLVSIGRIGALTVNWRHGLLLFGHTRLIRLRKYGSCDFATRRLNLTNNSFREPSDFSFCSTFIRKKGEPFRAVNGKG